MTIMKITLIWLNVSALFGRKDGCHTLDINSGSYVEATDEKYDWERERARKIKKKKSGSELKRLFIIMMMSCEVVVVGGGVHVNIKLNE